MNGSSSFFKCLAYLPDIRVGAHQYIEACPRKIYWFVITHVFGDCLVLQPKKKNVRWLAARLGIAAQSKAKECGSSGSFIYSERQAVVIY